MTLAQRISENSQVDPQTGCWNWTRTRNWKGYGQTSVHSKTVAAHRVSYEVHNGPIPAGMHVCHHCDNPACVNPDHLFVGTTQDNMDDMVAKGRQKPCIGTKHGRAKITEDDVIAIRAANGVRHRDLAARFGIAPSMVSYIRSGKYWKHVSPQSRAENEHG